MRQVMFTVLALLCAATVSAANQGEEEKEAKQLFEEMELKLDKAKAFKLTIDINCETDFGVRFQKGTQVKGTLAAMTENKLRMDLTFSRKGVNPSKRLMISDGTRMADTLGSSPPQDVPKNLMSSWATVVARSGVLIMHMPLPPTVFGQKGFDLKEGFAVSEFKLGKKAKVGERELQQLSYLLDVKGNADKFPFTLWIDLKTGLPVKRRLDIGEGKERIAFSETYEVTLDGKLDSKMFALPK